jgi:signal transduction histidine kinase
LRDQALQAGDLVHRTRNLLAHREPQRTALIVNDVVHEALAMLDGEFPLDVVHKRLELDEQLPAVSADPIQIRQVLINLIRNGCEAMADRPTAQRELTIRTGRASGGDVEVAVSDLGTGIPDEMRSRLFEPFQSTKEEGLGMGLAICRSIIEAHHGHLWAEANRERGTTFRFTLPLQGIWPVEGSVR